MAPFDPIRRFIHIKNRTEGTSNEISFSVLDAKSKNAEQHGASPRTISELGQISVFTIPGKQAGETSSSASGFGMSPRQRRDATRVVSGALTLGAQMEVASRKQRRRSRRLLKVAAALALLGVAVVAGGEYINSHFLAQRGTEIAIQQAIVLLEQTDETLVALDEAVAQPASSDSTQLTQIVSDIAAATSLLDRSANSAEDALSQETEDANKEAASEVKEAALARKALLEAGKDVLTYAAEAKSATSFVNKAWDAASEGGEYAAQAAELIAAGSSQASQQQNLSASNEASTNALAKFQEALLYVRQAKSIYPKADLSKLEAYIQKRADAQQNALVSNAALQQQDTKTADINSLAYNQAEQEAAKLASQLPADPAQAIVDAYEQLGGKADEVYMQARERAARADAEVRELREHQGSSA